MANPCFSDSCSIALEFDPVDGLVAETILDPDGGIECSDDGLKIATIPEAITTPFCAIRRNTAATVADGVSVFLAFNETLYDNDGMADLGGDKIVIQHAGIYLLDVNAFWDDADSDGRRQASISVDGVTSGGRSSNLDATAGANTQFAVTCIEALAAGAEIQLAVFQNSGSNLSMIGTVLRAVRLGTY